MITSAEEESTAGAHSEFHRVDGMLARTYRPRRTGVDV